MNYTKRMQLSDVTGEIRIAVFLIASMWLCSATVRADLVVDFSNASNVGLVFDVEIGSTETISVLLTESTPNTELSADGLIGYGLRADYAATSGTSSLVTDYRHNPAFNFSVARQFDTDSLDIAASAIGVPEVTGVSVLLGEMDVQVSAVGTTVFTFDDRTPGSFSNFATQSGVNLDPTIFAGSRTFSLTINGVSSVPEPSTCVLLAAISSGGLLRRRKSSRM